jgi:hypothetical protein
LASLRNLVDWVSAILRQNRAQMVAILPSGRNPMPRWRRPAAFYAARPTDVE